MHWTTMPTTLMTPSSSQSFTRLPQPAKGGLTPAFSVETKQQQQSGTCRPQPCCTSSVRKPDNKTAQPRGGLRCFCLRQSLISDQLLRNGRCQSGCVQSARQRQHVLCQHGRSEEHTSELQ